MIKITDYRTCNKCKKKIDLFKPFIINGFNEYHLECYELEKIFQCIWLDKKSCKNGSNDFDGLCSIEACPLSENKMIEMFGLEAWLFYKKSMLETRIYEQEQQIKFLENRLKEIQTILNKRW